MQQELFTFNVASREVVRSFSKSCDGLRKININQMEIRPGFNARRQRNLPDELWEQMLGIPELAAGIYESNGPADPILGDIAEDGKFYQTDGERRMRAIKHLIREGKDTYPNGTPVDEVTIRLNPTGTTDLDRRLKAVSTQENLKLRPMDKAYHILKLKQDYDLTDEELAKRLNISRQSVNNYIKATELPQDAQDAIDEDRLKISNALADYRRAHAEEKKNRKLGIVDLETGEVHEEDPNAPDPANEGEEGKSKEEMAKEREKEKYQDGDEDEMEQKDNTVTFAGSKNLGEDRSSGAHTVGKDSIYMQQQRKATFLQFIHRYHHLYENATKLIVADMPGDEEDPERSKVLREKRLDRAVENLMGEYDITVK